MAASVISRFEQRFTNNEASINTTNVVLNEILRTLRNQGGSTPATKQSDSPSSDGVSSPDLGNSKGESGAGRVSTDRPKVDWILWKSLQWRELQLLRPAGILDGNTITETEAPGLENKNVEWRKVSKTCLNLLAQSMMLNIYVKNKK